MVLARMLLEMSYHIAFDPRRFSSAQKMGKWHEGGTGMHSMDIGV